MAENEGLTDNYRGLHAVYIIVKLLWNNNMKSENINELIVKSQKELDALPVDFDGVICIDFGKKFNPAVIDKKYKHAVEVKNRSYVVAKNNCNLIARDESYVEAWNASHVMTRDNSSVSAFDNSFVEARNNSFVEARDSSYVKACDNSYIKALDQSNINAVDHSHVRAYNRSHVKGHANAQIIDCTNCHLDRKIEITDNAKVICEPKTIEEYMRFYGIKHTDKKGIFYIVVRKINGYYFTDDNLEYIIGETTDVNQGCVSGIHLAFLTWCLFGEAWDDLAILECEVDLDKVVVPLGREIVITDKIKVVREV